MSLLVCVEFHVPEPPVFIERYCSGVSRQDVKVYRLYTLKERSKMYGNVHFATFSTPDQMDIFRER